MAMSHVRSEVTTFHLMKMWGGLEIVLKTIRDRVGVRASDVTMTELLGFEFTTEDYNDVGTFDPNVDYRDFVSQCEMQEVRSFRESFLPVMYAVICVLGVLGNGLVVLTFIYFKRLKTMTDIYLLNLALADLLFLFTLPFWAVSVVKQWIFGQPMCRTVCVLYKLSFFSGMLLLMCISIDRYFSIVRAASAHRHRSRAVYYSKIISGGVWILAFILSMPELLYSEEIQRGGILVCKLRSNNNTMMFTTSAQLAMGFFIPFLVMIFCYSVIVKTLLISRSFEKNKAIKVIFSVVVVFILFQLPYNSVMLLDTISSIKANITNCDVNKRLNMALDVTKSLAYVRCCLNPFLYAFIGVKFRKDLLRLLKGMGCLSSQRLLAYINVKSSLSSKRGSIATDTDSTTTYSP
uniref:Chemokine (C-C motif) receptor 7 n=2 Tax=Callorhinchus milii TaxID=7868 RepID=A0A4W3K776_CALMI